MDKLQKMIRFLPSVLQATTNPYMRGLLHSWSSSDDEIYIQLENAKDQLYVKFAESLYLDYLGSNVGYIRPRGGFSDDIYRQLIPLMSFTPKQIKSTMERVLNVIYGGAPISVVGGGIVGQPKVPTDEDIMKLAQVYEINPNEIIVIAPWNIHPIDNNLRGAHHFKLYSGKVISLDYTNNVVVLELDKGGFPIAPNVREDEWMQADIGQKTFYARVLSNDVANSLVTLQINVVDTLGTFNIGEKAVIHNAVNYPGGFIPSPTAPYVITKLTGILGQTIEKGKIYTSIVMQDASSIPNTTGDVVISYGSSKNEIFPYLGRTSDTAVSASPSYIFKKNHVAGEVVNYTTTDTVPRINGADYSVYFYGIAYYREVMVDLFENQLKAAGIVVRFEWTFPTRGL